MLEAPAETKQPNSFLHDLQSVAGFLFFLMGSIYFCMALFLNNGFENTYLYTTFNILDIPFCVVSLLYAGASLKLSFIDNNLTTPLWNGLLYGLGGILFALVLYINFFF